MKIATRKTYYKSTTIVDLANALREAHQLFEKIAHDLQILLIRLHKKYDAVDTKLISDDNKIGFGIRLLEGRHTHMIILSMDLVTKSWYLRTNEKLEYTTFSHGRSIDLGKNPNPLAVLNQLRDLPQLRSVRMAGVTPMARVVKRALKI